MSEPGLDLPLALALASSLRDRPVVTGTVAIGEVGLLGELRAVGGLDRRLREAARLGFTRALVPRPRGRDAGDPRHGARPRGHARRCGRAALAADASRRAPTLTFGRICRVPGPRARLAEPVLVRRRPRRGGRGPDTRRRVIRTIRVLGAALGALIGLGLASIGTGLFTGAEYAGFILAAWTIAWAVVASPCSRT